MSIKTKAYLFLSVIVILILANGIYQCRQAAEYKRKYEVSLSNEKAYEQSAVNNPEKQIVY